MNETDTNWSTEAHGKQIKAIFFPSGEEVYESGAQHMHLSATHHGDHDEFWVVVSRGGKEIARHNPRHLESIVWADS